MIKCPECEKEVSSFAPNCPNCGYPLGESFLTNDTYNEVQEKKKTKKVNGKIIAFVIVALLFIGVGGYLLYDYMNHDAEIYSEAEAFLNRGDYEQAFELLLTIPEYEKTNQALLNVYFESRFFEGFNELVKYVKNPNSLSVVDITFYDYDLPNPPCVVVMSGQNSWGGFSSSNALIDYAENEDCFTYLGMCDYPNMDSDDCSDLNEYYTSTLIGMYQYYDELENVVDIERISNLIENKCYYDISRIDDSAVELINAILFPDEAEDLDSTDEEN